MKRRPRKVIVTVLVFLLLGAIVNIAVAWGVSLYSNDVGVDGTSGTRREDGGVWWTFIIRKFPGVTRVLSFRETLEPGNEHALPLSDKTPPSAIPWVTGFRLPPKGFPQAFPARDYRSAELCGWPMLSMWCQWAEYYLEGNRKVEIDNNLLIPLHRWGIGLTAFRLPARPIWPGFAINTLFYAAILWLLLALPGALRRWRRIKRGQCPACAYPVGMSDLCTECGKPVTRRFAASM